MDRDILHLIRQAELAPLSMDPATMRHALRTLGQWVKELQLYGHFRRIPAAEARRRLDYLLAADLSAYLGASQQAAAKLRWQRRALNIRN